MRVASRLEQHSESAGLTAAIQAQKLRKGPPDEQNQPPVRPLPGKKPKALPGQLDLDGNAAA